jgi:acyl-coenzyme A thioesterase PaaI-like protein
MQLLPYTRGCFVCGTENPRGLHVKFHADLPPSGTAAAPRVQTEFTPRAERAGFKGIVHGGLLATLLDEAMFWAAALELRKFCVSAELNVRFKHKAIVGNSLLVSAQTADLSAPATGGNAPEALARRSRRLAKTEAEIRDAATGKILATATAKFVPLDDATAAPTQADFCPDAAAMRVF